MILRNLAFPSLPTVKYQRRTNASPQKATAGKRLACLPRACEVRQAHKRTYDQKCERRVAFDDRKHVSRRHRADTDAKAGTRADDKRAVSSATRKLAQSHHKLALLDAVQWACDHSTCGLGFRQHTQRVAGALARLQPGNEVGLLGRRLAGTWILADVSAHGACGRPLSMGLHSLARSRRQWRVPSENLGSAAKTSSSSSETAYTAM